MNLTSYYLFVLFYYYNIFSFGIILVAGTLYIQAVPNMMVDTETDERFPHLESK